MKDIGSELQARTDSTTKCCALSTPGATSKIITDNLNLHTTHLTPVDYLIYMSGTNDMQKCEGKVIVNPAEEEKNNVLSHAKHTNVIMVTIPHRKDDKEFNQYIDVYNNHLKQCIDKYKETSKYGDRITLLDVNLILENWHYTRFGLHLNKFGKEALAQRIVQIKNQIEEKVGKESF